MLLNRLAEALKPADLSSTLIAVGVCSAVATAARWLIDPVLPPGVPYFTFWLAVDAATLWAGWAAGIATTLITAVIGWYIWLPPRFSFALGSQQIAVIVTYLVLAGAQVALMQITRAALLRMRRHHEARQLLVRELAHSIQNQFAVFRSVAMQTLRSSSDVKEATVALDGRLSALSAALSLAVDEATGTTALEDIVRKVVEPLAPQPHRLTVMGPPHSIAPEQVASFALVLNELATNAIKYGAWRSDTGTVTVSWKFSAQSLVLDWRESGGVADPPPREGFGTKLIERAIANSTVEREIDQDGYKIKITVPLGSSDAPILPSQPDALSMQATS